MKTISFLVMDQGALHAVTDVKLNEEYRSAYVVHQGPATTRCDLELRVTILENLNLNSGDDNAYVSPKFGHVRHVSLFKAPCADVQSHFQEWFDEALSYVKFNPIMVPTYQDGQVNGMTESRFKLCPRALNAKALRVKAGLSRGKLTDVLPLTYPTYLEMEQCRRKVTQYTEDKVKQFYKVDTDRLTYVPHKFDEIIGMIHSLKIEDRVFIETAIERLSLTHELVNNKATDLPGSVDALKLMSKGK